MTIKLGNTTTQTVSDVAKLKTLDLEPGSFVRTDSYTADYLTSATPAINGSLYEITTLALYRIKISDGSWTPDGAKNFYLNNGNIAVDLLAGGIDSVATMKTLDLQEGTIVETKSYYNTWLDGSTKAQGGAKYQIVTSAEFTALTGIGTADGYGDHVLTNGNVAMLLKGGVTYTSQYGMREVNTIAVNQDILELLIRNFGLPRREIFIDPGTYQLDIFNPNNCLIHANDVTFEFTYNATKSQVMGQITDSIVYGLHFKSLETDLQNQRCNIDRSEMHHCKFTGWRNPTNNDSWGAYVSGGRRVLLSYCGFQDNTQSDIAVVDGAQNIRIIQCYALDEAGDPLHINLEPNTSSQNNSVIIESCALGRLYLLDNATGGTSNKSVQVNNCNIDELTYDGASVQFNNCQIDTYAVETEVYFGNLDFNNSISIGPNLLADPYMINNAFSPSAAGTDSNDWYMNARSGGIGGDQLDALQENSVRFTRINPTNASGTINFRPTNTIAVTAGEYYLVAVTGRNNSGSSARYLQIFNGSVDKNCRIFRQSNQGFNNFITEMAIIPVGATGSFLPKVGLYTTESTSCDIVAISVHKILGSGANGNVNEMIKGIHNISYQPRQLTVSTIPTMSDANVNGFQLGDTVVDSGTNKIAAWDGSAFNVLW